MKARFGNLLALLFASVTLAQSEAPAPALSLDEAAENIVRASNGKLIRATQERRDGRDIYIIRVLTEGGKRVRHFELDAATGQPLGATDGR